MDKKIMVIGGTGFIGTNLVAYLVSQNQKVIICQRKKSNPIDLKDALLEYVIGDITYSDFLNNTLFPKIKECRIVYNLVVCSSASRAKKIEREKVNISVAGQIAQLVHRAENTRLVHVSSSTAVGYPLNDEVADESFIFNAQGDPYAFSKYQGELLVREEIKKGLDAIIVIPCSTMGGRAMKKEQLYTFKSIAEGRMIVYPSGGLCLTYIADLVRGLVLCSDRGKIGDRYIIGGSNISYKEYFFQIAKETNGKKPIFKLPKRIIIFLGFLLEFGFKMLGKESPINKNVALMISKNLFYSSQKAQKELGYQITDWKIAIRKTVEELSI